MTVMVVLAAAAFAAARLLPPRGRWRGAALATLPLLALAAIGVRVPGSPPGGAVLLVDVSYSTGVPRPDIAALGAASGLEPAETRVVLFGASAAPLPDPSATWPQPTDAELRRAGRGGSDLAGALRAAARLVSAGGRVVVATDGRVLVEAAREAAAALRSRCASVRVLTHGVTSREDARVDSLRIPSRVRAGTQP
ncbi:MAG: hypothetical protein ACYTDY_10765, partial [Planctomycetota bacterium]